MLTKGRCKYEWERAIDTKAIIKHYLEFGESVGSRTLEKKYSIGVFFGYNKKYDGGSWG